MDENWRSLQATTLHLYGLRWESTNLLVQSMWLALHNERGRGGSVVLVIALELLGLVLAIGLRVLLPWAVVESVGLRGHIVV